MYFKESHMNLSLKSITGYHGVAIITSLSTVPPQEAVESNEIDPQLPFLQTRQAQILGHSSYNIPSNPFINLSFFECIQGSAHSFQIVRPRTTHSATPADEVAPVLNTAG